MDTGDLSEYELLRLENIRRNNEFLLSLGLAQSVSSGSSKKEEAKAVLVNSKKRQKAVVIEGTRKSSRLNNISIDENSNSNIEAIKVDDDVDTDTGVAKVNYDDIPVESHELDDFEFEIFIILKKWRLLKCRSLDIEPYKIFQNRTLVEVIRRRRNDSSWAKLIDNNTDKRKVELLETWGIGNSKVQDGGYGIDLIELMDMDDEINKLFTNSRKNNQQLITQETIIT
jgi:hypothetical protein